MSSIEMSMDSIMEDSDYSVSNTNAIIFYGASDFSVRTESLISGPNIPNSSSTSVDDYDFQQQISTAAGGGGGTDDLTSVSSSASSSWFKNNNKQSGFFSQPRPKRRGTHWYIGRNILCLQQLMKMHPFRPAASAAAGTAPFSGAKTNLNVDSRELSSSSSPRSRPHECSICGLEFLTGQALGGHIGRHRAAGTAPFSGAKTNLNVDSRELSSSSSPRSRPHECSICGLEFLTGQALGGHIGRHRAAIMNENVQVIIPQIVKRSNSTRVSCLDLNLMPMENDLRLFSGEGGSS